MALCGIDIFLDAPTSLEQAEPPQRSEFLNLLRISEFFGFQWQNLAEILSLLSEGQFDPI